MLARLCWGKRRLGCGGISRGMAGLVHHGYWSGGRLKVIQLAIPLGLVAYRREDIQSRSLSIAEGQYAEPSYGLNTPNGR